MKEIVQLMEEWQFNVGDYGKGCIERQHLGSESDGTAMVVGPRVVGYPGG